MTTSIELEFHSKRHTDFDLCRVVQAEAQGFPRPVTAYLTGAFINARAGVGVVFGHKRQDEYGRFADGHIIRTSDVVRAEKEGRFWVLTTVNSRYVLATFQRGNGRASLRSFLRLSQGQHHLAPHLLQ